MHRVVLADDNALVIDSLIQSIPWETHGCEVVGRAKDGRGALETTLGLHADILITDIRMPILDGLTVAESIHEAGARTRVIIITGFAELDYARRALRSSAVDFILKPIDNNELEAALDRAIAALPANADPPWIEGDFSPLVRRTLEYLEAQAGALLTLEAVAGHMELSSGHLSRVLKKETGLGFVELVNRYRIHEAIRLLKTTNLKVYEVAARVGFENPAYFHQVFRKLTGQAPRDYVRKPNKMMDPLTFGKSRTTTD